MHSTVNEEQKKQEGNADTTFEFDPEISPEQRFIEFKASNIGRVLNLGGDGEDESEEDELDELADSVEVSLKDKSMAHSSKTRTEKSKKSGDKGPTVSAYIRR